jgi:hypothetical protein
VLPFFFEVLLLVLVLVGYNLLKVARKAVRQSLLAAAKSRFLSSGVSPVIDCNSSGAFTNSSHCRNSCASSSSSSLA